MNQSFIDRDRFIVNEQFAMVKNTYDILDDVGNNIGQIQEQRSFWHIIGGLFLSKALLPFHLDLIDENNYIIATIERGFTLWMSKIKVYDGRNNLVGMIKQKFKWFKPEFEILDANDNKIATIKGSLMAWDFNITNNAGEVIGNVNKKFNGVLNELFTTKDKYIVEISPNVTDPALRTLIASVACSVDLLFKENK